MKIQVLSDLHWEFNYLKIKQADCDVLVLAGDQTASSKMHHLKNITDTVQCDIIYITGNHEYYGSTMDIVNTKIEEFASSHPNFHFLNNRTTIITKDEERVRFIGSTLWTDFGTVRSVERAMTLAQLNISDFRQIRSQTESGFGFFTPQDCLELNLTARAFLEKELQTPFEGKTVVVTHFLPSEKSTHPLFEGSPLNSYFSCNCENLMGPLVDLWIHGHTHQSINYVHDGTRVMANPRGYYTENQAFNGKLVTEI